MREPISSYLEMEKHAVHAGGGSFHQDGLFDGRVNSHVRRRERLSSVRECMQAALTAEHTVATHVSTALSCGRMVELTHLQCQKTGPSLGEGQVHAISFLGQTSMSSIAKQRDLCTTLSSRLDKVVADPRCVTVHDAPRHI